MGQQPIDTGVPLAAPRRRGPSVAGYWIAGGIALAGFIVAAVFVFRGTFGILGEVNAYPRFEVPGSGTMTVDEPGGRVVFYEGSTRPHYELLGLQITGPDGAVPVAAYVTDLTYTFGGRTARAIATFEADIPGSYTIRTTDAPEPGARIAIGQSFAGGIVGGILGAFAAAAIGIVVAIVLFIVTFLRRRKAGAAF